MWASDSSIMTISRQDLHDNSPIHYSPRIDNNNHLSLHHLAGKTVSITTNNNNNNIVHRDQHHSASLGSINQTPRIVVPRSAELPQMQLPRMQQLPQSVPSTPISSKHVTASSYADYENYLFIWDESRSGLRERDPSWKKSRGSDSRNGQSYQRLCWRCYETCVFVRRLQTLRAPWGVNKCTFDLCWKSINAIYLLLVLAWIDLWRWFDLIFFLRWEDLICIETGVISDRILWCLIDTLTSI